MTIYYEFIMIRRRRCCICRAPDHPVRPHPLPGGMRCHKACLLLKKAEMDNAAPFHIIEGEP